MTTIYVVQGIITGEFTEVLTAHTSEDAASKFTQECEDYDKVKSNRNVKHPAGREYDYYEIQEVELE